MRNTILSVLMISLFFISGCKSEKTPVRIGVNDWPPCEIWYIAQKQGYFGELPVEIVRFSVWSDNMKSLYMGNTDITHSTYYNALHFIDKGEKARIIISSDTITGGDGLAVKNEIASVKDLKGKKIAVEADTDEHFLLYKTLKLHGINIGDTTLINSSASEGKEIFVSGKADSIYTYEPFLSEAAKNGGGKVIATTKDIPGYMIDTIMASENLLKKRPEDVRIIVSAWFRAQEYIKEHPEESFRIMAANEKMSEEDFGAFFKAFRFYSAEENRQIYSSEEYKKVIGEIAGFIGLKPEKYRNIMTTDFLPE